MPPAAAQTQSGPEPGIEYAIYTFDAPDRDDRGDARWLRADTLTRREAAFQAAEKLAQSGRYEKVEIKQKYFDRKKDRIIALTVKTFGKKKSFAFGVALSLLLAATCGAVAFAVTYFLTQGG